MAPEERQRSTTAFPVSGGTSLTPSILGTQIYIHTHAHAFTHTHIHVHEPPARTYTHMIILYKCWKKKDHVREIYQTRQKHVRLMEIDANTAMYFYLPSLCLDRLLILVHAVAMYKRSGDAVPGLVHLEIAQHRIPKTARLVCAKV